MFEFFGGERLKVEGGVEQLDELTQVGHFPHVLNGSHLLHIIGRNARARLQDSCSYARACPEGSPLSTRKDVSQDLVLKPEKREFSVFV